MKNVKKVIALLIAVTLAGLAISTAAAATGTANNVPSVTLCPKANDPNYIADAFTTGVLPGQAVYIYWSATPKSSSTTVYVVVTFSDVNGNPIPADTIVLGMLKSSQSGTTATEFTIPSLPYGDEVYVNFYGQNVATHKTMQVGQGSLFIMPESAIGALAALGAGLAAFGIYQIKLKKK